MKLNCIYSVINVKIYKIILKFRYYNTTKLKQMLNFNNTYY